MKRGDTQARRQTERKQCLTTDFADDTEGDTSRTVRANALCHLSVLSPLPCLPASVPPWFTSQATLILL